MKKYEQVSTPVIKRLPRYHRYLEELKKQGVVRISSKELSQKMGLTASQIRQDLNCFGGFGQQGYGYNVELLTSEIAKILGLDKPQKLVIIGIGNLGRAIATHIRFDNKGYELIGLFDQKESLIGQVVHNLPVRSMDSLDEFCKENQPTAAVLCIPKESAEAISYKLVKLGIKGFLNFSHYDLGLAYPGVSVENVHFGDKLMVLSYKMHNND